MKDEGKSNGNDLIIADCNGGLLKILRVQIQHCYGKTNKCANAIARKGTVLSQDFIIFSFPLANVALLASLDVVGTLFERNCSFASFSQLMNCSCLPKKKKNIKLNTTHARTQKEIYNAAEVGLAAIFSHLVGQQRERERERERYVMEIKSKKREGKFSDHQCRSPLLAVF